jgi:6-phosphogluconolactonase
MTTYNRRIFLRSSAGIIISMSTMAKNRSVFAYVGTYSSPEGPEGSKGNGKGIYLFEMDSSTGALTQRQVFPNDANPSCLAFTPDGSHIYSANEISNYEGARSGSVSAYSVNRSDGGLKLLNTVSSEGAGPAHLSVHPSGKWVFVANYHGGTIAVLPIVANGSLGAASDVKRHEGTLGPVNAASGPPGSFAISGHDHPHAHMIQSDPSGKFVLATDLALDKIYIWQFDAQSGKLSPSTQGSVSLPPGDGPRHFAFHPNARWMYSLQEEASTMVTYDWDGGTGKLTEKQLLSTLPHGFAGTDFTSEVAVSSDGKFVYAANRLHNTIAWFSVSRSGTLTLTGEEWTRGDYPRSFSFDPSGNFLYVCNQRSDAVTTFRVNRKTGALTFTGQYTPVGTPSIIVFLA